MNLIQIRTTICSGKDNEFEKFVGPSRSRPEFKIISMFGPSPINEGVSFFVEEERLPAAYELLINQSWLASLEMISYPEGIPYIFENEKKPTQNSNVPKYVEIQVESKSLKTMSQAETALVQAGWQVRGHVGCVVPVLESDRLTLADARNTLRRLPISDYELTEIGAKQPELV